MRTARHLVKFATHLSHLRSHIRQSRLLILYERFADRLLQISKSAAPLFRSSKGKDLFFTRLSVNTVLSRFDSTRRTLPPCSSAIRRARVSPKPLPLDFPAVTNGSNRVLRTEAGIPGPLSEIVTQICSSTSVRRTITSGA